MLYWEWIVFRILERNFVQDLKRPLWVPKINLLDEHTLISYSLLDFITAIKHNAITRFYKFIFKHARIQRRSRWRGRFLIPWNIHDFTQLYYGLRKMCLRPTPITCPNMEKSKIFQTPTLEMFNGSAHVWTISLSIISMIYNLEKSVYLSTKSENIMIFFS